MIRGKAEGREEAGLEPPERMLRRQQVVAKFLVFDDCVIEVRQEHNEV